MRVIVRWTIFPLLLLTVYGSALAQDSLNVHQIATIYDGWDRPRNVAVEGNYAYVASERTGVRILDISVPAYPQEVGVCRDVDAADVVVDGNFAYVAGQYNNFVVYDISDPSAPVRSSVLLLTWTPSAIAFSDNLVFIVLHHRALVILDVSDPANPVLVGEYEDNSDFIDLVVRGSQVFLADIYDGLVILDVSDPANPVEISSSDTPGQPSALAIEAEYVYLADPPNLRIFDISDVSNPVELGELLVGGCQDVVADNQHVYTTEQYGVHVYDAQDPANPVEVAMIELGYNTTDGLTIQDEVLFVPYDSPGMRMLDISTPAETVDIGGIEALDIITNVTVSGDYAYVTAFSDGLRILDVHFPDAPVEMSSLVFDWIIDGAPAVQDGYAYVLSLGLQNQNEGLIVVDVHNPYNPVEVGFCPTNRPEDIKVDGDYAYLADGATGPIRVIDISNPEAPQSIFWQAVTGGAVSIELSDGYVFLGGYDKVHVFNRSDPSNLIELTSINLPDYAFDLAWADDVLYVASEDLYIYDVQNPENPALIATFETDDRATGVEFADNFLYLAEYDGRVHVLNAIHPASLRETGYYELPESIGGLPVHLAVQDELAYATQGFSLKILDCSASIRPYPLELELSTYRPIVVPAGGSFEYSMVLTSHFDTMHLLDIWTEVVLPNGDTWGPVWLYSHLPVLPGMVLDLPEINQDVPLTAPSGVYTYMLKVGDYPNAIAVQDQFRLTVYSSSHR